ncbi:MAG: 4-hydroxy-3-methylbut-2-enyl diphosphate reductase [Elusimicrobiota bacterium]
MAKVNILKGNSCGFCSGVRRAIKIAKAEKGQKSIFTLGPIIHNPQVVENLEKNNIIPIDNLKDINDQDTVLIRSHGVSLEKEREIRRRSLNMKDATCPNVKRAHRISRELRKRADRVFIAGIESHPEVKGIVSRAKGKSTVITSPEKARKIKKFKSGGLLAQTTFKRKEFFKIADILVRKAEKMLEVHNTICKETLIRQKELKSLADKVDILIVIGGKNSSNTKRLHELGKERVESHHVEVPEDIDKNWFVNKSKVGIITGASTPIIMVEKVENEIKKLINGHGPEQ